MFDNFSEKELLILEERAKRIAHIHHDDDMAEFLSVLGIEIYGENYAVFLDDLTAIYEELNMVSVPCAPSYVKGVANVRGRILPVIELGKVLDIPFKAADKGDLVIVENTEQEQVAFYVDRVGDVSTFTRSDIEQVPSSINSEQASHMAGMLPDGTTILNVKTLVSDPKYVVDM